VFRAVNIGRFRSGGRFKQEKGAALKHQPSSIQSISAAQDSRIFPGARQVRRISSTLRVSSMKRTGIAATTGASASADSSPLEGPFQNVEIGF
jgi:hypothetical protein